jgi:hypothetical protein
MSPRYTVHVITMQGTLFTHETDSLAEASAEHALATHRPSTHASYVIDGRPKSAPLTIPQPRTLFAFNRIEHSTKSPTIRLETSNGRNVNRAYREAPNDN